MNIKKVGELHRDSGIPEWLESEEIAIPFLGNQRLTIIFQDIEEDKNPEEFEKAIGNFLQLSEENRKETNRYIFSYYKDITEMLDDDAFEFTIEDENNVWDYVQPTQVYVGRRSYGDKAVYVSIAAECDWEPEHGLQIVHKEGKELKRVSGHDSHLSNSDAYDRPEFENVIFVGREQLF